LLALSKVDLLQPEPKAISPSAYTRLQTMNRTRHKLTLIGMPLVGLFVVVVLASVIIPLPSAATDLTQPISFSHKTHSETNAIQCQFCHVYARRSKVSGIPSLENCLGCHKVIKGSDDKQRQEIQKLVDYWQAGNPIPWKKIHDLPDFVHYSHKRHISAGYDCTQCHGEIQLLDEITMETMKTDLSMGWCLECHNSIKSMATVNLQVVKSKPGDNRTLAEKLATSTAKPRRISKDCLVCHK
jgi:hypothetical protein